MTRTVCVLLFLALTIQLSGCSPTPGQRLILTKIELNGQVILQGMFATSDDRSKQETLNMLMVATYEPIGEWKPSDIAISDELQPVDLDGKIRVLLLHADQTYGEASLNKLRLYYDQAKNQYQLMGPEVARIKQVIK